MKNKIKNNNGFTLIELLVVVLIIGVLAAIALPQYNKTVLKVKFSAIKTNARILYNSTQQYYLLNNVFPDSISQLDVQIDNTNQYYSQGGNISGIISRNQNKILNYYIDYRGRIFCLSYDGIESGNNEKFRLFLSSFCQQETGKPSRDWGNNIYSAYEY